MRSIITFFDRIFSTEYLLTRSYQDHSKAHAMSLCYHKPWFAECDFIA
jgi:hypothetical protein